MLTGEANEALGLDAVRHGIQDYLIKGQTYGRQTVRAIRYAIERKQVEEALKRTEEALRASERQLRKWNLDLERRVAERTASLEETISDLEDFSHSITHDLRAPLRAIRSFAQILGEECLACGRPAAQEHIHRITSAAERMDKLILDVLQYSRLARSKLRLAPVDVQGLLRSIIETYPAFQPPQVEIRIEGPLPRVLGNEAALTQCFSNLLGNAIKFVAPGTRPQVRVWAEPRKAEGRSAEGRNRNHAPRPSPLTPPLRPPLVRRQWGGHPVGGPSPHLQNVPAPGQELRRHRRGPDGGAQGGREDGGQGRPGIRAGARQPVLARAQGGPPAGGRRQRRREPGMNPVVILYVEDEENDVLLLRHVFAKAGLTNPLQTVKDGKAAKDYLAGAMPFDDRRQHPLPGLVLLDLNLPYWSGLKCWSGFGSSRTSGACRWWSSPPPAGPGTSPAPMTPAPTLTWSSPTPSPTSRAWSWPCATSGSSTTGSPHPGSRAPCVSIATLIQLLTPRHPLPVSLCSYHAPYSEHWSVREIRVFKGFSESPVPLPALFNSPKGTSPGPLALRAFGRPALTVRPVAPGTTDRCKTGWPLLSEMVGCREVVSAPTVKVLLVEDSPTDAALLCEALSQKGLGGFDFTHAESWSEAATRLQNHSFDLMLLDLSLPDVTGRDTFLRARAAAPHLAIVVLTGMADEAVGLEAVRHGIQDYLIKGQAFGQQTARAIRYAIERKQAETALQQAEAALQCERDQLEDRVRERTAELLQSNRALQTEIAHRERAETAHRQVLRRLVAAEETERGRVSRELHDRLGQDLTALKLGLQLVRKQGAFAAAERARERGQAGKPGRPPDAGHASAGLGIAPRRAG